MRRGRSMSTSNDVDHPAGAGREEHHAIRQAGRLPHVVGDEHDAEVAIGPEALELGVQEVAGHGVEGAEGLVHEEDVGLLGEGPGDGDPLAHAARELVGHLRPEAVEVHGVQQLVGLVVALPPGDASELQGQLDVRSDRQPREQRRLLEHESDPSSPVDRAGGGLVEPGDEVEEGGLAASRRADEADELAGCDVEVDAVERMHRVGALAVDLRQPADVEGGQRIRREGRHARRTSVALHGGRRRGSSGPR